MPAFYESSLCIPQSFSFPNPDLHHGLLGSHFRKYYKDPIRVRLTSELRLPQIAPEEKVSSVDAGDPGNEFYKKGCQEKSSPSTGGREDFCLEIQPTVCKCPPPISLRGFALACLPFLWVSSFGGDDANRVLKLGKRTWSWSVNHGSIGGSWPIAISGYPRRHNV